MLTDKLWNTLRRLCHKAKKAPLLNTRSTIRGWFEFFIFNRQNLSFRVELMIIDDK